MKEKSETSGNSSLRIGGNIGKNKTTPNENAWQDYSICFEKLFPWVDYFVVNVSSPNTPGLRELQEKESLRKILTTLQKINREQLNQKPLFLKISPDLSVSQLTDVIELAEEIQLDGVVACNTSISREGLSISTLKLEHIGSGGLSGTPLRKKSNEFIRYISEKTNNRLPIIGSGGICCIEDANEKILLGSDLIQIWTGLFMKGPRL